MDINFGNLAGDVGVGGVVGFITGYALKKFIQIVLALIGAYVLSLFWLQQKGVISINTDALFNLTQEAAGKALSLSDKVLAILPGGGAFIAGFYLGFHKG
ncbi:FUN14 domain-containing protein [Palaeococcus ferrophilus]|uniref:FUN14 domain-containing protein n=1 Tax=Palaeococcus ferrophilus TaxID=83868 RepID=UPI00064E9B5C|nr:FUN14 domain-containing protein [Palaeococcus ferrophilus]